MRRRKRSELRRVRKSKDCNWLKISEKLNSISLAVNARFKVFVVVVFVVVVPIVVVVVVVFFLLLLSFF